MTLIELLIVMLIISILAALVLGVAAVAGQTAREAQTQHTVLRLHRLLMEQYDTYKTRRVKVNKAIIDKIDAQLKAKTITQAQAGQLRARARLNALRELMILEMPDRWSDILLNDVPSSPTSTAAEARYPIYIDPLTLSSAGRTPLSEIYLRRYARIAANNAPTKEVLMDNEGAECLYLIITLACGDGEARSQFGEDSIGDTDNDGAYEFLDGWGHPIQFLRWAPGFNSLVQLNPIRLSGMTAQEVDLEIAKDYDPFDLYRVDVDPSTRRPRAFRLVPLIYSAGRDETYGIRTAPLHAALYGLANSASLPTNIPEPQPYALVTDKSVTPNEDIYIGQAAPDAGATDNVHNHLLGRR
jgi:type II secretory pathway pseudopilin PulG